MKLGNWNSKLYLKCNISHQELFVFFNKKVLIYIDIDNVQFMPLLIYLW